MNKSWRVVGLCGGDDEQPHPSPRRIAWTAGDWCKASSRATQGAQLLISSERSEGSRISDDEAQLPPSVHGWRACIAVRCSSQSVRPARCHARAVVERERVVAARAESRLTSSLSPLAAARHGWSHDAATRRLHDTGEGYPAPAPRHSRPPARPRPHPRLCLPRRLGPARHGRARHPRAQAGRRAEDRPPQERPRRLDAGRRGRPRRQPRSVSLSLHLLSSWAHSS